MFEKKIKIKNIEKILEDYSVCSKDIIKSIEHKFKSISKISVSHKNNDKGYY